VLPIGVPSLTGLRGQTGATGPGPLGGMAAHVRLQIGLAGQPDHGRRMRRGPLGQAVRNEQLLQVS
jgi:hypothetical protein